MDPFHVTLDPEVLERLVARIVAEVAKPRPAEMAGESGWSPVSRKYGAWAVIGTHEAEGFMYSKFWHSCRGRVENRCVG